MKKRVLVLLVFICAVVAGQAQSADMARMLQERDRLYQQYDSLGREKNALFGGRSKKDFQAMVLSLLRIISKDNEIIREVRRTSYEKESNLYGQSRLSSDRIYDLEQQVAGLNSQLKRRTAELTEQRAATADLLGAMRKLQIGVVLLTALLIGGGFYLFRRRAA